MVEEESTRERMDRNWNELLQELRVAQTGVQILTAFLLTLPFQPAFKALSDSRTYVYVGVLLAAMTSMLMLLTPVACIARCSVKASSRGSSRRRTSSPARGWCCWWAPTSAPCGWSWTQW